MSLTVPGTSVRAGDIILYHFWEGDEDTPHYVESSDWYPGHGQAAWIRPIDSPYAFRAMIEGRMWTVTNRSAHVHTAACRGGWCDED